MNGEERLHRGEGGSQLGVTGLTLFITERPGIRLRSSRRVRRAWRSSCATVWDNRCGMKRSAPSPTRCGPKRRRKAGKSIPSKYIYRRRTMRF
jgi:hypothetical protein